MLDFYNFVSFFHKISKTEAGTSFIFSFINWEIDENFFT